MDIIKIINFLIFLLVKEGVYKYPIKERIKRVKKYKEYATRYEKDLGRTGKKTQAEGLDFSRTF
ncbi:MAG: hypothetical protein UR49_C0033G0012 [candidate division WS6 bacterium GW2011_GWF2_33_92]|nr:MAG: hypothetical protein UR49_C0033G0012 [candidate division WS6 bacterium GW2011_GWF2_33_92]